MVVFILVAALGVIEVNPGLGYTILVGDVIYLIASVLCYEYTEKMINNELLTAGFEQSQIQKQILKELPVPYVMTDQSGTIIWYRSVRQPDSSSSTLPHIHEAASHQRFREG